MKKKTRETLVGYAFIAPMLLVFIPLVLAPVVISLVLSFTKWNFFSGLVNLKWVGFQNFVDMFTKDRSFKKALLNTVVYTITTVPITIFLALIFAYAVNGKVYCQKFLRLAFFIPYISNMVALGAVFRFLFRSDGPVNQILMRVIHLEKGVDWLGSPSFNKIPVICVMIYAGIGFCMIVYIAALKGISPELYEAAQIDGATTVRQFFSITIPLVSPTTFYLLIVRMINAFQVFAPISIISGVSNSPDMTSIVVQVYEQAFKNYNFGYASAESWILVLIILIITLIQFRGQNKWVNY